MVKPPGQSGNREHFRIPTFVYHFCKMVLLLDCHRMELGIAEPLKNLPFGARTHPSSSFFCFSPPRSFWNQAGSPCLRLVVAGWREEQHPVGVADRELALSTVMHSRFPKRGVSVFAQDRGQHVDTVHTCIGGKFDPQQGCQYGE